MKTYLVYGCGIAIASSVLTLVLYFLGYHNDPDKFQTGQNIASMFGFVIPIVGLFLGMRKVRDSSEDQSMTYGRGVATGALISLVAGIVSAIFVYVYGTAINPEYHELTLEIQTANLEESGLPQAQLDQAVSMLKFFAGPLFSALTVLFLAPLFGVVFSLILAIIVKRKPVVATSPPEVPGS